MYRITVLSVSLHPYWYSSKVQFLLRALFERETLMIGKNKVVKVRKFPKVFGFLQQTASLAVTLKQFVFHNYFYSHIYNK